MSKRYEFLPNSQMLMELIFEIIQLSMKITVAYENDSRLLLGTILIFCQGVLYDRAPLILTMYKTKEFITNQYIQWLY